MARVWCLFFMIWPVLALYFCWIAPDHGWSFPGEDGLPVSVIGEKIDHLFWVTMGIVTVVFIGTQIALGYVLWTTSQRKPGEKTSSSHGNSKLELIWTVIPWGNFVVPCVLSNECLGRVSGEVASS